MKNRSKILSIATLGGLSCLPAVAADKPNVVFILLDDYGYHQMGCYGSTYYETPCFDKIASEGMRFTNAYASAALSSPTRAALMTGKYPARLHLTDWLNGNKPPEDAKLSIPDWTKGLAEEDISLPVKMKANGYTTSLIGKWHCSKFTPGWDEIYRFDGPKSSDECDGVDCHRVREYTERAKDFISRNKDKPFFCFLSHNAIHTPETEEAALVAKYRAKSGSMNGGMLNPVQGAMVETADKYTGELMDFIDGLGLSENTLVIVTSDNGQYSPQQKVGVSPLRGAKCTHWEGGYREPLLVRWKGKVVAGSVCNTPVITHDFLPTLSEICGFSIDDIQDIDGKSFAKNMLENPETELDRPYLCWHYPHYHPQAEFVGSIRKGDWKLIENFNNSLLFSPDNAFELYNLADDPKESQNLVVSNPSKSAELYADLQQWRADTKAQMPEPKRMVYGKKRFQLHSPEQGIKVENFDSHTGVDEWLRYDGGTFLTLKNNTQLSFYINITESGNYKLKFLYSGDGQANINITGTTISSGTASLPKSNGWEARSTDDIAFTEGLHLIKMTFSGNPVSIDKFALTRNDITLVHDGEKPIIGETVEITFDKDETEVYLNFEGSAINQNPLPEIVTNPYRDHLNPTEKCLYTRTKLDLNSNPKVPAWSSNHITFTFHDVIDITEENRYFHAFHWKGNVLNTWLVYASEDGNTFSEINRGNCPEAGKWFDIVVDLKSKIIKVKKIRIYLDGNWGNAADRYFEPTDFYYDEILMNDDPDPRRAIITDINTSKFETSFYPNPVETVLNIKTELPMKGIKLYDLNGSILRNISVNGNYETKVDTVNLFAGIYIVNILYINGNCEQHKLIKL